MKKQLQLFSNKKTISGFETTYKNAPADVKKILDGLDFMEDYGKLEKAKKALMKKGYYLDYGLDGAVTEFRKVRTAKKVGYKPDRLKILKVSSKLIKKYMDQGYNRKEAVEMANNEASYIIQSGKNVSGTKTTPVSTHKDTKSHNVNIRVVSGVDGSEYFAKQLNSLLADKKKLETDLMIYKQRVKEKVPFSPFNALHFKRLPAMIKSINIQIRESKKHIK